MTSSTSFRAVPASLRARPSIRQAHAELGRAQKPGAGVPFYMRTVNRRLGRRLAAVAARLGVGPNQVTAASAVCAMAAMIVLLVASPSVVTALLVVGLLQLGFALDSADGQLARLTGGGSVAGEWLDHVVDAVRGVLLHLVVAVALAVQTDVAAHWLLLPLVFATVASTRFFAQILAEQLRPRVDEAESAPGRWAGAIQTPADAGVINLVFLFWPWPPLFLAAYAVLAVANAALLSATVVRRYRELASVA